MDNKEYDIAIIIVLQEEMDQVRLAFDVYLVGKQSADKLGRGEIFMGKCRIR